MNRSEQYFYRDILLGVEEIDKGSKHAAKLRFEKLEHSSHTNPAVFLKLGLLEDNVRKQISLLEKALEIEDFHVLYLSYEDCKQLLINIADKGALPRTYFDAISKMAKHAVFVDTVPHRTLLLYYLRKRIPNRKKARNCAKESLVYATSPEDYSRLFKYYLPDKEKENTSTSETLGIIVVSFLIAGFVGNAIASYDAPSEGTTQEEIQIDIPKLEEVTFDMQQIEVEQDIVTFRIFRSYYEDVVAYLETSENKTIPASAAQTYEGVVNSLFQFDEDLRAIHSTDTYVYFELENKDGYLFARDSDLQVDFETCRGEMLTSISFICQADLGEGWALGTIQ